ncbi:MAG TPA: dTMP kinase [Bacilli bacterium]|nr:dTMP kinase [Bacilli bacterium]
MKGIFITFEGNEGSGKTTVIQAIKEMLVSSGVSVTLTREPGGSKIAEQIRNIILDKNNVEMDAKTEALLLAAARKQHLVEVVLPALKQNHIVLCDRYVDSSLAYQGYARGIGIEEVYEMNLFATDHLLPNLTIYIDITPELGLNRIASNNRNVNRLDLENLKFHQLVHEGYAIIQNMFPNRIVRVDGNQSKEKVIEDSKQIVMTFLNRK